MPRKAALKRKDVVETYEVYGVTISKAQAKKLLVQLIEEFKLLKFDKRLWKKEIAEKGPWSIPYNCGEAEQKFNRARSDGVKNLLELIKKRLSNL